MTGGIASDSAGVVTSAALIMVAVFSIFATLPLIDLKILGIGTAAAVLIDATVVRGILVPAALSLLGERTWYLPRPLRWLPSVPNPPRLPPPPPSPLPSLTHLARPSAGSSPVPNPPRLPPPPPSPLPSLTHLARPLRWLLSRP